MTTMQLVERHIISSSHASWQVLDDVTFRSKNLWNAANYIMRQTFLKKGERLSLTNVYYQVREAYLQDYEALPRKVSNQVLIQLDKAWKAWSQAHIEWEKHPEKFLGRPKLPQYKHKTKGRNLVVYEKGAISKRQLREGRVAPSQLGLMFPTQHPSESIQQVRIVPRSNHCVVEVIYEVELPPTSESPYVAGVDIGIDNLAAVASNQPGLKPLLVNGRPLKAMNQYYNKRKAQLQSQLQPERYSSIRIQKLTNKRNQKIDDYLHKTSRTIIDWCIKNDIGTLVIGKNKHWKQAVNIGKRNNQNFTSIPHVRFIDQLCYKAQLAGIHVIVTEESYTSKCSFLDMEPIGKQESYAGKRVKRGLFRTGDGRLINADINGAFNIIRKAIPNAFADGIEGIAVRPVRITPCERLV